MPKNLIELIKASGKAGIDGQTFANDVTGADTNVAMSDYLCGVPSTFAPPDPNSTYPSGQMFAISIQFSGYGPRYYNIRRNDAGAWQSYGTALQTLHDIGWNDATASVTLNVTVLGEYDSTTLQTLTGFNVWFVGYTYPNAPTSETWESVEVTPAISGSLTPSGATTQTLQYYFDPDSANFNPSVWAPSSTTSWPVTISRRAYPGWSTRYEWEIHANNTIVNGSYNSLINSNGYTFTSFPGTNYGNANPVGYVQYRLRAEYNGGTPGAWTFTDVYNNTLMVVWTDPRNAL